MAAAVQRNKHRILTVRCALPIVISWETDSVKFTPALYHAGPATLLAQIAQQTASTLALCAHNPGIGELAARLVTTAPTHPRFQDYPTAAMTLIRFDAARWRDIRKGTCVDFTIPRDLNG